MSNVTLQILGIISGIIGLVTIIPYYIDILRGRTKPQRSAFLIFAIVATVSFFSQLGSGATASLWFAGTLMLFAYITYTLSLKFGVGGLEKRDLVSLVSVIAILIVWYITKSPEIAVVLIVLVNTIGKILVILKVYEMPHSDLLFTWVMSIFGSIFAALSVGAWDWILLLAPVQNGVTVAMIAAIIYYRRKVIPLPVKTRA